MLSDFDAVEKYRKRAAEEKMREHIQKTAKRLKENPDIVPVYPPVGIVEHWKLEFSSDRPRYRIMVVVGASGLGKTDWVLSLFSNPFVMRVGDSDGWPSSFKYFEYFENDAIILDDVRSAKFLVKFQHILQAKGWGAESFGDTQGGQLRYEKYVYAKPFVVTMNPTSAYLEYFTSRDADKGGNDFLGSSSNVLYVDFPPVEVQPVIKYPRADGVFRTDAEEAAHVAAASA